VQEGGAPGHILLTISPLCNSKSSQLFKRVPVAKKMNTVEWQMFAIVLNWRVKKNRQIKTTLSFSVSL
jgi:hypothetical protein